MTKSEEDLAAAFAGESQANRKYLAFAKVADKEGLPQIARVFRSAAAAETIHAHNHLRALGGIKTTPENLKEAIEGEHYEFTKMYPEFLEDSKSDGNSGAQRTFHLANEVEKIHHKFYETALKAAESGKDLDKTDIYVCPVCGYPAEGSAPDACPVCGTPKDKFMKID